MKKTVGFDQKLSLSYLDKAAEMAISNYNQQDIYISLDEFLSADVGGCMSRKHIITILMKTWISIPDQLKELRDKAVKLYICSNKQQHLALHWGMILLAYPFFKDCVSYIGHQFRIQGNVTSSQLRQNIKGIYGDRNRVEVAIKAVNTTLRNIGFVVENTPSVFEPVPVSIIDDDELSAWLSAVSLYASDRDALPVNTLAAQPYLYPFSYKVGNGLHDYRCLYITTQGVSDSVAVKRERR